MKAIYDVPAPAKLNLFLHITGKRSDGYHLLQSVFVLIDWCDQLHFEVRGDGALSREDLTTSLPPDDLVLQAARKLQHISGTPLGAHIGVAKHVPAQAGMGGGSSDAATCLLALNRLWHLGFSLRQLSDIGLTLGADVPFFLHGHNAWVQGIGEHITPLVGSSRLIPSTYAVIKPFAGVNTAEIFRSPNLKRDSDTATIAGFAADQKSFCKTARNDLAGVARQICPDVSLALEWLTAQGFHPRMTGSGSAVFAEIGNSAAGVCANQVCVQQAWQASSLSQAGWQFRVCSNLEVHPLLGWALDDE